MFGICLFISTLFILAFIFFPPKSVGIMFASQILHGFFYGLTIPLLWAMIADVADYSEWKNNRRATAIIFSAMMVGLKAGLSIGGALLTWILGLYHYVPNSDTAVCRGNSWNANAGKCFSIHSIFIRRWIVVLL